MRYKIAKALALRFLPWFHAFDRWCIKNFNDDPRAAPFIRELRLRVRELEQALSDEQDRQS